MPLAGHCQINVGNGSILIHGGATSLNGSDHNLVHTQNSWIWNDKMNIWTLVASASPCNGSKMPPTMKTQCSLIKHDKVVIITQNYEQYATCTNILNTHTFEWTVLTTTLSHNLPLGGFLITGTNKLDVFYLGGHTQHDNSDNKTVYELSQETRQWTLTNFKLRTAMTNWDSIVLDNNLNLTQYMADKALWPHV